MKFRASMIGLVLISLVGSGCASVPGIPGFGPKDERFDPGVQAELLRKQQEMRAATQTPAEEPKPLTLEQRLFQGDALRRDGDYAKAMWIYLQAHDKFRSDPAPISRMASLHLTDDADKAETLFRNLLDEHPESVAAHTGLGLALIARSDWEAARDSFVRATSLGPSLPLAYSSLGVCLDRLGEFEAARAAYRTATDLLPNYYEALNNLGVSYLATEEFSSAEKALDRAARLEGRDPAVHNNLGLALGRLGRYGEALEAFSKADPNPQVAHNNLGYVAYLNGDFDRALSEYEKALLIGGSERLNVLRNFVTARNARDAQAK